MSVSLGQLDNRVFQGLAAAAEFLSLEDVHNAVVQRLNTRTMESRTSDINVLLGTSAEFTPDAVPYDVTSLIGKSVPCWVETKGDLLNGVQYWYPVRSVNQSDLNDYARMGAFACSFYSEESTGDVLQPVQYISFTFLPVRACRIRYDRDNQRTALDADIILPDNLSELIVLEAQNSLIPRIKLAMGMRLRSDEEGRRDAAAISQSLQEIYLQNVVDIKPLDAQWKVWAFRDRAAQDSHNNPTPRSEGMYAGGRNRQGGWGTGGSY